MFIVSMMPVYMFCCVVYLQCFLAIVALIFAAVSYLRIKSFVHCMVVSSCRTWTFIRSSFLFCLSYVFCSSVLCVHCRVFSNVAHMKKIKTLKIKIWFIYICLFSDAHEAYKLHLVFTLRDFIHATLCALTYLRVPFIVQVEIDSLFRSALNIYCSSFDM